jgi:hypothetical protein
VVSVTDPYSRILGFLDRACCVNPTDNTHYAPITTTPSTRTMNSHKILHSLDIYLVGLRKAVTTFVVQDFRLRPAEHEAATVSVIRLMLRLDNMLLLLLTITWLR